MKILLKNLFHQNSFFILEASPRDGKAKIIELADLASLSYDSESCNKARSDLTNPRNRISAEISWLPGTSPKKTKELIALSTENPAFIFNETALPFMVLANLWLPFFESVDDADSAEKISDGIVRLSDVLEKLSPEDICRDINEDRMVSGFPLITSLEIIEEALSAQKKLSKSIIKDALNRLSTRKLIEVTTKITEIATVGGEKIAPDLIYLLVDSYEIEAQEFLNKEYENVEKLSEAILSNAANKGSLEPNLSNLIKISKNFVNVAKPIQIAFKSRGLEHELSQKFAYKVRGLAVDLHNKHDLTEVSLSLTKTNKELFENIPVLVDALHKDEGDLLEIKINRSKKHENDAQWAKEITYSAEIGLVMKETLSISPKGASYGSKNIPLEKITSIGWGAVSNSYNGIPLGTEHTIFWGDGNIKVSVSTRHGPIYTEFTNRLWKATASQLLDQMINRLRAGNALEYSQMTVWDDRVLLKKSRLFSKEDIVSPWSDITIMSYQGSMHLTNSKDNKITGSIPYMTTRNAHVLEALIRTAFKKPGMKRLSEAFEG